MQENARAVHANERWFILFFHRAGCTGPLDDCLGEDEEEEKFAIDLAEDDDEDGDDDDDYISPDVIDLITNRMNMARNHDDDDEEEEEEEEEWTRSFIKLRTSWSLFKFRPLVAILRYHFPRIYFCR